MEEAEKTTEAVVAEEQSPVEANEQVGGHPDREIGTGRPSLQEEIPPEAPPADVWRTVRELALKQLDRMMALEPKVLRGDDPDAIHDIRVATRRLQQVLDLIYPPPPPRNIRRLRRRIQRTRRALGEVRNCDVQLDHVRKTLRGKRASRRQVWEAVQHYLRQRRASSFDDAVRKLSKVNLAVLYVRLKEYLAADGPLPVTGRAGHQLECPADLGSEEFYERVGESLDRVWDAFETQIGLSHRDPRGPVLHGVRIAAKRVRYLIEVIHEFGVPGSADTLAWLRGLQQHLGDWHDLEVLELMMIDMLARPDFLRSHLELAMGVEKLILQNRTRKLVFEEKYLAMTRDAAEFERVKEWVGYLRSSPSAAFARA